MSTTNQLRKALNKIPDALLTPEQTQRLSNTLMKALLEHGSQTEDNRSCTKHIEYGWATSRKFGPSNVCGFKIKDKAILVSDIAYELETLDLFDQLHAKLPELTQIEYDAVMRLMVLVLTSLEQSI